jgi:hypothetical protein
MNISDIYQQLRFEFSFRQLVMPDNADQATDFALTELGEVKELLLNRMKVWNRNNPQDKHKFSKARLADELGDVIRMCIVAGLVEGLDPLEAMILKSRRKVEEHQDREVDKYSGRIKVNLTEPPDEMFFEAMKTLDEEDY